jgi:hypothetical protein
VALNGIFLLLLLNGAKPLCNTVILMLNRQEMSTRMIVKGTVFNCQYILFLFSNTKAVSTFCMTTEGL